ncbi:MAG: sugar phosphate isomerase/epimerase [Candidatus Hydrogenedentes bacterium]|nr:sugar phosphate isomerase/epimerase [Candidatus Hydrogenedentota bacterium]
MKAGINQWAFPQEMPTVEAISLAKEMGFQAFEVCVDEAARVRLDATESEVKAIRAHAEAAGIRLCSLGCGLGWKYPLSSPDPKIRDRGKEVIVKSLQIGQWLGVDAMLVVPGMVDAKTRYDIALENALAAVQDLVPEAEKRKVAIAIENVWNKLLLSPVEMRDFIDQCESEYIGAYFDTGNIVLYGYPEQWIRILGRRIKMIHAKDFRSSVGTLSGFVMLMEGDVNWPEVVRALREVGYDDALIAEFGPYHHSLEVMLRHVATSLNTIMAL